VGLTRPAMEPAQGRLNARYAANSLGKTAFDLSTGGTWKEAMMIWQDTSSFSQGEKDRTPTCWTARAGVLQIVVHRHIHYEKTAWLLSCDGLRLGCRELSATDIADAKRETVEIVRGKLMEAIESLRSVE